MDLNAGFILKFDGKEECRCCAVSFDYDEWTYALNNGGKQNLPPGIESIEVEVKRKY